MSLGRSFGFRSIPVSSFPEDPSIWMAMSACSVAKEKRSPGLRSGQCYPDHYRRYNSEALKIPDDSPCKKSCFTCGVGRCRCWQCCVSDIMNPTLASVFVVTFLLHVVVAVPPYLYDGYTAEDFPVEGPSDVDKGDLTLDPFLQPMNKRSCIRRGGRCDHRPDDCCSGGACRCNLWGTNCHCQRMGIFQKWG